MVTLVVALGLAAVLGGGHVTALQRTRCARPFGQGPSVPTSRVIAARFALPVLGFLRLAPPNRLALPAAVVTVGNLVPVGRLRAVRVRVGTIAICCGVVAALAIIGAPQ